MTVQLPRKRKRGGISQGREDQAVLERYLNDRLDQHEREIAADEQWMTDAEHQAWLAKNPRRWALHRAIDHRDLGPMRELVRKTLGDGFEDFVNFPKRRRKRQDLQEYISEGPQIDRRTNAVWEARRAEVLMKRLELKGYTAGTFWKVAAHRAGLDVDAIKDWERHRACRADPFAMSELLPD